MKLQVWINNMKKGEIKWFTLIEIIIVIALISTIFLVTKNSILWPIIDKKRVEVTSRLIHKSVNNEFQKSISWYGGKALDTAQKDEKDLIPEDFILYFKSNSLNDENSWFYQILESQIREENSISYIRTIKKNQFEYWDPSVYLWNIVWKINEDDSVWEDIDSIWVSFSSPTWKISFFVNIDDFVDEWNIILSENEWTINEFIMPTPDDRYSVIELEFYQYWEKVFLYKIYKEKIFVYKFL